MGMRSSKSNYERARNSLPKSNRKPYNGGIPKWERPSNKKLLHAASARLTDTLSLEEAAKVLGFKSIVTTRAILRKYCTYEYDQWMEKKKNSDAYKKKWTELSDLGRQKQAQHRRQKKERLEKAGANMKDYCAYLYQTCQTKTEAAKQIRSLSMSMRDAIKKNKPEVQMEILKQKQFLAKTHFRRLRY